MSKYIDADKLQEICIKHRYNSIPIDVFKSQPSADVVEVKHGKWERRPDPYGFFDDIPVCSECGCTTKYREETLYCPNCGADMRERRESE